MQYLKDQFPFLSDCMIASAAFSISCLVIPFIISLNVITILLLHPPQTTRYPLHYIIPLL